MSVQIYQSNKLQNLSENVFEPMGKIQPGDKARVWLNNDVEKLSLKVEKAVVDNTFARGVFNRASKFGTEKITGHGTLEKTNSVIQSALTAAETEVEAIALKIREDGPKKIGYTLVDLGEGNDREASLHASTSFYNMNIALYDLQIGLGKAKTGIANLYHTYLQEKKLGLEELQTNINRLNTLFNRVVEIRSCGVLQEYNRPAGSH